MLLNNSREYYVNASFLLTGTWRPGGPSTLSRGRETVGIHPRSGSWCGLHRRFGCGLAEQQQTQEVRALYLFTLSPSLSSPLRHFPCRFFLVLDVGGSKPLPAAAGDGAAAKTAPDRKGRGRKGPTVVERKRQLKARALKRGRDVPLDSKYSGRKRSRVQF